MFVIVSTDIPQQDETLMNKDTALVLLGETTQIEGVGEITFTINKLTDNRYYEVITKETLPKFNKFANIHYDKIQRNKFNNYNLKQYEKSRKRVRQMPQNKTNNGVRKKG